jgi:hypothetical protein
MPLCDNIFDIMKNLMAADDIYSALKPVHHVYKIFGLAPFSYITDKKTSKGTVAYRRCDVKRSVLWTILMLFGLSVHMSDAVYHIKSVTPFKVSVTYYMFVLILYSTSIISLVLGATVNRRRIPEILCKFASADDMLFRDNERSDIFYYTKLLTLSELIISAIIMFSYCVYSLCGCCNAIRWS